VTHLTLVTGAAGQLGRDVMRSLAARDHQAIGLSRAELDITDAAQVHSVVQSLEPDAIVHCAAYTAVDDAESHRDSATAVNVDGSRNIAQAAASVDAYLIGVSTDYVFDGADPAGYDEHAATGPINVYGETKLAGERELLACEGAAVARTAWLFGRDGTNFVRTIARLAASRDAIDVVTDQVGSPTYTAHLADALVRCVEQRPAGVLHLAGSPVATWNEIAKYVVEVLGVECEVRPTTSDAFPRPAARPACSILRSTRPDAPTVGDWRDGVRALLAPPVQLA
jgi:dTDP-4-dehydrorhamnose reductase